jgi:hypothetical protein
LGAVVGTSNAAVYMITMRHVDRLGKWEVH